MRAVHICTFCDAADQVITVRGKKVRFDFSERFGPLVLDDEGNPLKKQPISERDPFWEPFNAWLGAWTRQRQSAAPPNTAEARDHVSAPQPPTQ